MARNKLIIAFFFILLTFLMSIGTNGRELNKIKPHDSEVEPICWHSSGGMGCSVTTCEPFCMPYNFECRSKQCCCIPP
ncbi:hypothetical protein RND81_06G166500 [Saponaria officinalis]|uniref:Uncharacterized protein n=1 Tax=Saponaria officinalis TaxID=3572 RepID=A0AAW1KCG8_SAPOF